MCKRAECPTCNSPTYAGCGNHVEQVLGDVPVSERCQCADQSAGARTPRAKRSWFGTRTSAAKG